MRNSIQIDPRGATAVRGADIVTIDTYHAPGSAGALDPSWRLFGLSPMDALLAAIILVAAVVVRWPFIQAGETLLNPDEAIVGLMAQDIAAGERYPVYFYGQRYMGSFEAYVIAAIAPFFKKHVHALRFGPALVFAAMTALQYLMLTRWFGRRAAFAGVVALIAASPMFTHWSISARGGYIEVLLWGTALMWTYSEWFVPGSHSQATRRRHRFVFGAILGSGMWINPSIALFVLPIVVHALLNRPLAALEAHPVGGQVLGTARGMLALTFAPVAVFAAILLLNITWAVWVDQPHIRTSILMGVVPPVVGGCIVAAVLAGVGIALARRTNLFTQIRALVMGNASMIAGMIAGSSPAIFYAVQRTMSGQPLEPSLPLGIRPMWLIGETMVYLLHGLPLLLGADPRPFVQLMSVGHPNVTNPLSTGVETLATAANNAVFIALLVLLVLWLCGHARELRGLGRLRPGNYSPAIFLGGAAAISLVLYVFGACTMNFSTIRYLVPLWAFIPGLIASLWISPRSRPAAVSAIFTLLIAWSVGQWIMHEQVGRPHPMRPLADTLVKRRLPYAVAEPLDAHLLSYMTGRRCKVAEFESFWVRLPHYQGPHRKDGCVDYVVDTSTTEWTRAWTDAAWPGTPPPETTRFLWPRLQHELKSDPGLLVFREPLGQGYELIRLRRALRPRGSRPVNPSLSTSGTQAADAATGSQIDG